MGRAVAPKTASKKEIFEELRMLIMQGAFKPRERLVERSLAFRFQVSHTPVREALQKLAAMGMVRMVRNQGASVIDYSLDEIESLYLVRLHLEKLAGRLACAGITPGETKALRKINEDLKEAIASDDFPKMVDKDQQFHLALIRSCRNAFLIRAIEDLRLKSYPISYYYWKRNRYVRSSVSDHDQLIVALRRRDPRAMDRLIQAQLNNSKDRYLKYLAQDSGWIPGPDGDSAGQ
ncbi:MAG TPA: GntR family transcriptional regulator [Thermodesulfobacteriota bacterium]|nr:GntR family transcriptional regulator [Thermodesulfobacteriota bacterium]